MSHYTRPQPSGGNPRAGFIGAAVVASGLLGFYAYLHRRHNNKVVRDQAGKSSGISAWETRMMQRGEDSTRPGSTSFRASGVEARSKPVPPIKTEHDAHHRSYSEEARLIKDGSPARSGYEVPTAQRDGKDGSVYTKAPAWHRMELKKGKDEK